MAQVSFILQECVHHVALNIKPTSEKTMYIAEVIFDE